MVTSGYDDPDRNPIERYHTSNDGQMDEMVDLFIQLRTVFSTVGSCCRKKQVVYNTFQGKAQQENWGTRA